MPKPPAKLRFPYLTGQELAAVLREECVFAFATRAGAFWYFDPLSLGREGQNFEGWRILPRDKGGALFRMARLIVSHPTSDLRKALVDCFVALHGSRIEYDQPFRDLAGLIAREDPVGYTDPGCEEQDFSTCQISLEILPW